MFFQDADNSNEFEKKETRRHKTHVTALSLLVLTTFVVVFTALSMVGSSTPVERELVQNTDIEKPRPVASSIKKVSSLQGLPENLPLPETATTTQNYRNDLIGDHMQRVLIFTVDNSNLDGQLFEDLQTWATDNDFAIAETNRVGSSGIILAETPSSQLIIMWTRMRTGTRVEINYVRI